MKCNRNLSLSTSFLYNLLNRVLYIYCNIIFFAIIPCKLETKLRKKITYQNSLIFFCDQELNQHSFFDLNCRVTHMVTRHFGFLKRRYIGLMRG